MSALNIQIWTWCWAAENIKCISCDHIKPFRTAEKKVKTLVLCDLPLILLWIDKAALVGEEKWIPQIPVQSNLPKKQCFIMNRKHPVGFVSICICCSGVLEHTEQNYLLCAAKPARPCRHAIIHPPQNTACICCYSAYNGILSCISSVQWHYIELNVHASILGDLYCDIVNHNHVSFIPNMSSSSTHSEQW